MPEMDLNHADKWAVPPCPGDVLQGAEFTTRLIDISDQWLISGDLSAFGQMTGLDAKGLGALGQAGGDSYTLRLGRDRLLVVGPLPGAVPGWHAAGFAVSSTGAALAVLEIGGAGLPTLLAQATTLDPAHPGPSAAISFAGVPGVLYRHGPNLRLHVERGLTAYLWSWLERVIAEAA